MSNDEKILLEIKDLRKYFPIKGMKGPGVQAVQDVSFYIKKGETLGLVGESGCGKTTLGRTILRLHEPTGGQIIYDGKPIYDNPLDAQGNPVGKCNAVDMLPYRRKMQIIFQDPSASLDPRMTVGEIIGEAIDIHKLAASKKDRADMIKELLKRVGLNTEHANRYPHEFSGGQPSNVGIARALAVKPEFIVCDEPISALDVSIQSQVVNMLEDRAGYGADLFVHRSRPFCCTSHFQPYWCYVSGLPLVELGESYELNRNPIHPYTKTLLSAVPVPDPQRAVPVSESCWKAIFQARSIRRADAVSIPDVHMRQRNVSRKCLHLKNMSQVTGRMSSVRLRTIMWYHCQ